MSKDPTRDYFAYGEGAEEPRFGEHEIPDGHCICPYCSALVKHDKEICPECQNAISEHNEER